MSRPVGPVDVVSVSPDGTASLADGRQVKLVVADNGALGVRKLEPRGQDLSIDQMPSATQERWVPPAISSLVDQ